MFLVFQGTGSVVVFVSNYWFGMLVLFLERIKKNISGKSERGLIGV